MQIIFNALYAKRLLRHLRNCLKLHDGSSFRFGGSGSLRLTRSAYLVLQTMKPKRTSGTKQNKACLRSAFYLIWLLLFNSPENMNKNRRS